MRISDWSSDVCYSDLANYIDLFTEYFDSARRRKLAPGHMLQRVSATVGHVVSRVDEYNVALEQLIRRQQLYSTIIGSTSERIVRAEIGRASCRERVCTYG